MQQKLRVVVRSFRGNRHLPIGDMYTKLEHMKLRNFGKTLGSTFKRYKFPSDPGRVLHDKP